MSSPVQFPTRRRERLRYAHFEPGKIRQTLSLYFGDPRDAERRADVDGSLSRARLAAAVIADALDTVAAGPTRPKRAVLEDGDHDAAPFFEALRWIFEDAPARIKDEEGRFYLSLAWCCETLEHRMTTQARAHESVDLDPELVREEARMIVAGKPRARRHRSQGRTTPPSPAPQTRRNAA